MDYDISRETIQQFILKNTDKLFNISRVLLFDISMIFLIFIIFLIIYKLLKHSIKKILHSMRISERQNLRINIFIVNILKYSIIIIGITSWLTVTNIISKGSVVAFASIGSLAIGFGAQKLIADFIMGAFILGEDQYNIGDIIQIYDIHQNIIKGTVEFVGLRTTQIRSFDGDLNIIQNSSISIVTNRTKEYKNIVIEIPIPYENTTHIIEILKDEMSNAYQTLDGLSEVPQVLGISSFDESSISVTIFAMCEVRKNFQLEKELRYLIKIRFDDENISIPFPQRVITINKNTE